MSKNIYDHIGRPTIQHLVAVQNLLEPLKTYFGIDRFWRNEHLNDGSYSLIGNYPPTGELFFGLGLFAGHPLFRHPHFFQSGYSLPSLDPTYEFEETQGKVIKGGDCFHLLTYIVKTDRGIIEYGLSTSHYQPGFESVYLNNLNVITKFLNYFEKEAELIIKKSKEYSVEMPPLIGDKYNVRPIVQSTNTLLPDKQLNFLLAIEKDKERGKMIQTLSPSERIVLKHYLDGKSAKEVARTLFRSSRTVEKHLEIIKNKLFISSRNELMNFFSSYRDLL
jgi:DNA-binding CsgD family transcriptional regulator